MRETSAPIAVAALTSGLTVPSARFRVRQHIAGMRSYGVEVCEWWPAIDKYSLAPERFAKWWSAPGAPAAWAFGKLTTRAPGLAASRCANATWLERPLREGLLTLEPLLKGPVVFDVDDAVWLHPPAGRWAARSIARRAAVVVAGNEFLADWFSPYARDVRVVPTAVDTERWQPGEQARADGRFVVGWTGTASNLPNLYAIEAPLARFVARRADAELLVVADQRPHFARIPPERVRFVPWSSACESAAVRQMSVGVMPLPDSEWARGKCSFKMLQYMACGVPVVVSPVGMNAEVLAMGQVGLAARTSSEWYEAIEALYLDQARAEEYGRAGRLVVELRFSAAIVGATLAHLFRELA